MKETVEIFQRLIQGIEYKGLRPVIQKTLLKIIELLV